MAHLPDHKTIREAAVVVRAANKAAGGSMTPEALRTTFENAVNTITEEQEEETGTRRPPR